MYSPYPAREIHRLRLTGIQPGFEVVSVENESQALSEVQDAEIVIGHRYLRQCLPSARRLKWVQTTSNGLDHLPLRKLAEKGVELTRCVVASRTLARHAYVMAWALLRNLALTDNMIGTTAQLRWLPFPKTAVLLGMGLLGKELAVLLRKDGIRVIGVKQNWDAESASLCDQLVTDDSWHEVLGSADLCFCLLPLTNKTRGILDRATLENLPLNGIFINIGRAATVDEFALFEALECGRLGGVGLDVSSPDSPFRRSRPTNDLKFILTPYIGAHYAERQDNIEAFVESQVTHYLAGLPLLNRVELQRAINDI